MAAKIKVVLSTGGVVARATGMRHNKLGIEDQAIQGVAYDPDKGIFCFRDDAFNREWLAQQQVTLVVKE